MISPALNDVMNKSMNISPTCCLIASYDGVMYAYMLLHLPHIIGVYTGTIPAFHPKDTTVIAKIFELLLEVLL
jgi:hypothetical protein